MIREPTALGARVSQAKLFVQQRIYYGTRLSDKSESIIMNPWETMGFNIGEILYERLRL